jgi:hypothetical protein
MPVDFLSLFAVLNDAGVRYVVTGGLAAVLHGVDRLTANIDIAIDLASNAPAVVAKLLTDAGFRPMAPVEPMDFANAVLRHGWIHDRGMKVFSFWDTRNLRPSVDLMLDSPVAFDQLYADSVEVRFRGIGIRVASIAHLIEMKRYAGRAKDLADIDRLQEIAHSNIKP